MLTSVGVVNAVSAAFNTVKQSVSSAFGRIDTMNQFNRTVTAITGSAESAGVALGQLKDITKGTAYGLDVAAKATQNFVTRGLDISQATDQVRIWGDAVSFYGKGTNEQFENVTDALAKMRTKGKVEMDQLDRLLKLGLMPLACTLRRLDDLRLKYKTIYLMAVSALKNSLTQFRLLCRKEPTVF